jgi:flavin reductase (DIM6/NTAB) family NADH-FMN oxidoreductase RutF
VRNLRERPEVVINLVDDSMVDAIDRLALLTGRPDVPEYKRTRGYTYEADKYRAAQLTPEVFHASSPTGVAESPIQLQGRVQRIYDIDENDSGLRALEVKVLHTRVEESLLMANRPNYIDPLLWHPMIMKFTEYFVGGTLARPSSLAKGWGMPSLPAEAPALS